MKIKRNVLGAAICGVFLGMSCGAIGQVYVSPIQRIQEGGFEGDKPFELRFGTLALGDEFNTVTIPSRDSSARYSPCGESCKDTSALISCETYGNDAFHPTKNITSDERNRIISSTLDVKQYEKNHKKLGLGNLSVTRIKYKGGVYTLSLKLIENRVAVMSADIPYAGVSEAALSSAVLGKFGQPDLSESGHGFKRYAYFAPGSRPDVDLDGISSAFDTIHYQMDKVKREMSPIGKRNLSKEEISLIREAKSLGGVVLITVQNDIIRYRLSNSISAYIDYILTHNEQCVQDRLQRADALLKEADEKAGVITL